MTPFKADHRKSNTLLFLGVSFLALTYFTMTTSSPATKVAWTAFLIVFGLTFLCLALLPRYIVYLTDDTLLVRNRLGLFSKRIYLSDIKRVKVIDRDYPVTLYRNTLLHLILWDKKFSRFKQIQLLDLFGDKLFTIDGQSIDNNAFNKLVNGLKK